MPLFGSDTVQRIRGGQLTLGLGVHHLRGSAVPLLAKAAGYDWLFIDAEHGAISTPEIAQIAMAALPMGVVPIVRICSGALDEGTRALDNGALGIVVPHVDTPEEARRLVEAFRFAPIGHRSTGGSNACFGYRPPPAAEAQKILNAEILVIVMIETPRAVDNAAAIAAVEGIDALLIGSNDLSLELGIPGQLGDERVRSAYAKVAAACRQHHKVLGMGGVYDQELASRYIGMGARLVLAGSDHGLLLEAASRRAEFLRTIPLQPPA
ncbi:MAG TPA: aldolase/citrate lyase family protein [Hyphomicrobiaceae bacterium]|nr:aldolase/citrate lyase family protein [Hyphomicrobiaceae bacterium]